MTDRRRTRTPAQSSAAPPATVRRVWSLQEVQALGVTTDVVTAGQILGLSRNSAYTLARRGMFPVPVIKAGTRYRIPIAALVAALRPHVGASAGAHSDDGDGDPPVSGL